MNIFIARLNFDTTENMIQDLFENYGEVTSVKIVIDREKQRSKGFGFVEMPDDEQAKLAIEELNDTDFDDHNISVKEAVPKDEYQKRKVKYEHQRQGFPTNNRNNNNRSNNRNDNQNDNYRRNSRENYRDDGMGRDRNSSDTTYDRYRSNLGVDTNKKDSETKSTPAKKSGRQRFKRRIY